MTPEEKRARKNANQRAYRARNIDAVNARKRAAKEELRRQGIKPNQYPPTLEQRAAWRAKYREEIRAYKNAYRAAEKAGKKDPTGKARDARGQRIFAAAMAEVPASHPLDVRTDIAGELALAVMNGECTIATLPKHAPAIIRRYWKDNRMDQWSISLDAPRFEDGGSMHEVVSNEQGLWA